MFTVAALVKIIEMLTPIAVSLVIVLKTKADAEKTRADVDLLYAQKRANETGEPIEKVMRKDHKQRKKVDKTRLTK